MHRSLPLARAYPRILVLCVGLFVLLWWSFDAAHGEELFGDRSYADWPQIAIVAVVVVLSFGVHEGLHAAGFRMAGARTVSFGVHWKMLTPYAHTPDPMPARGYRRAVALPGLVLGALPFAGAMATGSLVLADLGALNLLAASGDLLALWLLRGVPGDAGVRDHPTELGVLGSLPAAA